MIEGGGSALGALLILLRQSLATSLSVLVVLFLFRIALRNQWLGLAVITLLMSLANLGGENVLLETPFAVLQGILAAWAIGRIGLLAGAAMWFYRVVFATVPLPIGGSTPYTFSTVVIIGVMVALAAYALHISVGSRRLFSFAALDDEPLRST